VSLDHHRPRRSRAAALALVLAIAGTFAAGAALFGLRPAGAEPARTGSVPGTHCTEQALRYGVTSSAAVHERQNRFERDAGALPVPEPGVYARALDPTASLHAVLHGSLVVYHRAGAAEGLAPFLRLAHGHGVPVVVSPREQAPAFVAIRGGAALTCAGTAAADIDALRAFAGAQFAALAG
jgi:hypothetical protein